MLCALGSVSRGGENHFHMCKRAQQKYKNAHKNCCALLQIQIQKLFYVVYLFFYFLLSILAFLLSSDFCFILYIFEKTANKLKAKYEKNRNHWNMLIYEGTKTK